MLYDMNMAISRMDEYQTQAQVLVPVLQAARAELGAERANRLVLESLRDWSRERIKQIGAGLSGSPTERWNAYHLLDMKRVREGDLDLEIRKREPEAFEYRVTHCAYADYFIALGEPQLGTVLACETSFHVVEQIAQTEVSITRSKTLMEGGCCCDICYAIQGKWLP